MIKIELAYNQGFPWHSKDGCHVRGFLYKPENQFVSGVSLPEYFLQAEGYRDFIRLVTEADGMFSVILIRDGKAFVASDRIRTFPLFYMLSKEEVILSDSVHKIHQVRGGWKLNQTASVEFLATGYVTGRETLSEDIFQVQAAEVALLEPGRIQQRLYYTYQTIQTARPSLNSLLKGLEGVTRKVSKRLAGSLRGRTAVVALSGGFDSRFIAAMLKQSGYEKVICFTYGREGNPDMLISEKVAAALGYRWIPVVYTEELVDGYLKDDSFYEYVHYTSNWVSMFFMQEYFAVRYLKERQLVPADSVFIPGIFQESFFHQGPANPAEHFPPGISGWPA